MLQFNLAVEEIANFLKTVTIKSNLLAQHSRINQVNSNYSDSIPDAILPYYRHIQGEYILRDDVTRWSNEYGEDVALLNAVVYTVFDEMMYVTSLDTGETIEFTRANLAIHQKTAAAYKIPSRFFTLLCEKYPKQTGLIESILYPCSVDPHLAEDMTLIGYDLSLLEENEQASMLNRLEKCIDVLKHRWNGDYSFEDLFPIVYWFIAWQYFAMALMAQRHRNIRTQHVHSLHIWEYLSSHNLGKFRGYLTKEQELFLYRNLDYIESNCGKHSTLLELEKHLLNPVGIYAKLKSIAMDITDVEKNDYRRNPVVITESLDADQVIGTYTKQESLQELITRLHAAGLETSSSVDFIDQQENMLNAIPASYIPTKYVELTTTSFNPRLYALWCRYVLDSWYSLASTSYVDDITYRFRPTGDSGELLLSFKEMLALLNFITTWDVAPDMVIDSEGGVKDTFKIPTEHLLERSLKLIRPVLPTTVTWDYAKDGKTDPMVMPIWAQLNIDAIKEMYPEVKSDFTSTMEIGDYLTRGFTMMNSHQLSAISIADMLTNLSIHEVYKTIIDDRKITVNLVPENVYYRDWFITNKDLTDLFNSIKTRDELSSVLSSISTAIVSQLLTGCTVPYAKIESDEGRYNMLKELVTWLCSYTITFIDAKTKSTVALAGAPFCMGIHSSKLTVNRQQYVDNTSFKFSRSKVSHSSSLIVGATIATINK